MITERQSRFRQEYLQQVSPWYHGLLHVGVMYAAGVAAIVWCVGQLRDPSWEWLLILPIAIAGNFVEWGMHMHIMHRLKDVFALRDRKSTRLNSSHEWISRMPSSA